MKTSNEVGHIFSAQVAMQATLTDVGKDKDGYGYKYASFDSIVQHLRPVLSEHGLGFIQTATSNGDYIGVTTRLIHKSGEWVEDTFTMPLVTLAKMNNYQVAGSAITYLKRYGLSAIVGIAVDEDIDASGEQEKPHPKQKAKEPENPKDAERINAHQLEEIRKLIEETESDTEAFCKWLKVGSLPEIYAGHYETAINQLNKKLAEKTFI